MSLIRLLLADDQPLVRAGIATVLSAEPDIEVIGEAEDGGSAVELARRAQPSLVVMDLRMSGTDGLAATRTICAPGFSRDPDRPVRVLILTASTHDEAVHGAVRAGASGFLLKDSAPVELVHAIRAIHAGGGWLAPAVTRGLLREFAASAAPDAVAPGHLDRLTRREREVLVLVAHGLSNAEIATGLVIGEGTVKTHLGRILGKLGVRDRAQAVVAAYQSGLVAPRVAAPVPVAGARWAAGLSPLAEGGRTPVSLRPQQWPAHLTGSAPEKSA